MKLPHSLSITGCLISFALSSATAFAHDGHGEHENALDGVLHWFTEWDHLAVLGIVIGVAAFLVRKRMKERAARAKPTTSR